MAKEIGAMEEIVTETSHTIPDPCAYGGYGTDQSRFGTHGPSEHQGQQSSHGHGSEVTVVVPSVGSDLAHDIHQFLWILAVTSCEETDHYTAYGAHDHWIQSAQDQWYAVPYEPQSQVHDEQQGPYERSRYCTRQYHGQNEHGAVGDLHVIHWITSLMTAFLSDIGCRVVPLYPQERIRWYGGCRYRVRLPSDEVLCPVR